MNWLLARLREPSTWRGIVWLATVAGLSLRPDQAEAIVTAGMALAGLLGVFLSDERPDSVGRVPVGGADSAAASGDDRVRDDLPPIELVGTPMGPAGREVAGCSGGNEHRAVPAGAANQLRESVSVPPQSPARPYQSADPNTYPRFGTGFGDRD